MSYNKLLVPFGFADREPAETVMSSMANSEAVKSATPEPFTIDILMKSLQKRRNDLLLETTEHCSSNQNLSRQVQEQQPQRSIRASPTKPVIQQSIPFAEATKVTQRSLNHQTNLPVATDSQELNLQLQSTNRQQRSQEHSHRFLIEQQKLVGSTKQTSDHQQQRVGKRSRQSSQNIQPSHVESNWQSVSNRDVVAQPSVSQNKSNAPTTTPRSNPPSILFGPNHPSKKTKTADPSHDSLLHNSCKLFSQTVEVIRSALLMDAGAIRRAIPIECETVSTHASLTGKTTSHETFVYPINIALKNNASVAIVTMLAKAGPDVLLLPDGPNQASTLSIALSQFTKSKSFHEDILCAILDVNRKSTLQKDGHQNTPLHYAARSPCISLKVLRLLVTLNPLALNQRNFHGQIPLDLALRTSSVPQQNVCFLQTMQLKKTEGDSQSFLHQLDVDIDDGDLLKLE